MPGEEGFRCCHRRVYRGRPAGPRNLAKAYGRRGYAYQAKGNRDKAIADYTEAIRLDPKDSVAHCDRGRAYGSKGEYDKAIADCTEAIRLDPKYADAYCSRGCAYGRKGGYDKEIADCTEAIRLNPKDAVAYYNRGYAYGYNGEYDKLIARLHGGHSARSEGFQGVLWPGLRAYGNKGECDKAITDCTEAYPVGPGTCRVVSRPGLCLRQEVVRPTRR